MQGQIVKNISNDYCVACQKKQYICKPRGRFRKDGLKPLVGDFVLFDENEHYLLKILPRKNELIRPPIANIDQAFLIISVKDPNFSSYLLDKLLVVIEYHSILPILIFTKLDLLKEEEKNEIKTIMQYYQTMGYQVYENVELDQIKTLFQNKVSVFTGQSGAGKSSLLNQLNPTLNLQTAEISYALGRGKHTTRHVELIPLFQGLVADTPGFSALDFIGMTPIDIKDQFADFNQYRDSCKYKDCMHQLEDGCKIKELVQKGSILKSRYDNYLKFISG